MKNTKLFMSSQFEMKDLGKLFMFSQFEMKYLGEDDVILGIKIRKT